MNIAADMTHLVGSTPLVRLNKVSKGCVGTVAAKLEFYNPCSSVKDRIGFSMIVQAEKDRYIDKDTVIIEPTSGNTGIGLAMVAAVKGYKLILTMPDTMSMERVYILESYGAEVVLTPGAEGMIGAVKKAEELVQQIPESFIPHQFNNPANPEIHRKTTAQEILKAMDGKLDALVAGVGTGGTITGVGEVLKNTDPHIKIIAVEPADSPVISGGEAAPHRIQGIGAGFIPQVLNLDIVDSVITVTDENAYSIAKRLAKEEGLFMGISAGAAAYAALTVAQELGEGKTVVVILPDTGERYYSALQHFNE